MKVFVTGLRGFPNIPGGIETHCERLYGVLASHDLDIKIARRRRYVDSDVDNNSGVDFVDIWSPASPALETIVHTLLSIVYAFFWRAQIVHIHAIGPGLLVPFARLLGMKVVLTHHGADYERQKWGRFAKSLLILGESLGCRFSHRVITVSRYIRSSVKDKVGVTASYIPNGAPPVVLASNDDYLKELGLTASGFVFSAARFVPEKGLHDLIRAYPCETTCPLVIAGDVEFESEYSESLKALAAGNDNVILTGYLTGEPLRTLFQNARLFVLPSYHEGLPIALLEAMSFGIEPLVSDIPAHTEVELPSACYFPVGDTAALTATLARNLQHNTQVISPESLQNCVKTHYNWAAIGQQTLNVYAGVMG